MDIVINTRLLHTKPTEYPLSKGIKLDNESGEKKKNGLHFSVMD